MNRHVALRSLDDFPAVAALHGGPTSSGPGASWSGSCTTRPSDGQKQRRDPVGTHRSRDFSPGHHNMRETQSPPTSSQSHSDQFGPATLGLVSAISGLLHSQTLKLCVKTTYEECVAL